MHARHCLMEHRLVCIPLLCRMYYKHVRCIYSPREEIERIEYPPDFFYKQMSPINLNHKLNLCAIYESLYRI